MHTHHICEVIYLLTLVLLHVHQILHALYLLTLRGKPAAIVYATSRYGGELRLELALADVNVFGHRLVLANVFTDCVLPRELALFVLGLDAGSLCSIPLDCLYFRHLATLDVL